MHCIACVDERTMGPVSLTGYSLYGERVGQPLHLHLGDLRRLEKPLVK